MEESVYIQGWLSLPIVRPYDKDKATTAKCRQWDGQKLEIDNDSIATYRHFC